jgi:hypothetical protein
MPLYFLDIETTGLCPKTHQVIEVAAIEYGSTRSAFHCYIRYPNYVFEHGRIKRLGFPVYRDDVPTYGVEDFKSMFRTFLYGQDVEPNRVTFAGKNVAGFDIPFLKTIMPGLQYNHRCIDIGGLFLRPDEDTPPALAECMRRANMIPIVPHNALEDAQICLTLYGFWRQQWLTSNVGKLSCVAGLTPSPDLMSGGTLKG